MRVQTNDYKFISSADENRDGTILAGGLGYRQRFEGGALSVTYEGGREDTDGRTGRTAFCASR